MTEYRSPERIGMSYPLRPDGNGSVVLSSDGDRVYEDVLSLLETEEFGRIMHPDYTGDLEVFRAWDGVDTIVALRVMMQRWMPEVEPSFDWVFADGILKLQVSWKYSRESGEIVEGLNTIKFTTVL